MGNNTTTYKIQLDAEISQLSAKLDTLTKHLTKIGAVGKFPDLDRALGAITAKLEKIRENSNQPASGAVFKQLAKDTASTETQLDNLSKIVKDLLNNIGTSGLELLPPDEAKKIRDITAALATYATAIERSTQKSKAHLEAEKQLEQANKKKAEWEGKLSDNTRALNNAKQEKTATEETLKATKEKISAKEEEIKAQEELIKKIEEEHKKQGTSKNRKITIDGKETSLQKERNKKKKSEADLTVLKGMAVQQESTIAGDNKLIKQYANSIEECNGKLGLYAESVARCKAAVDTFEESMDTDKLKAQNDAYTALRNSAQALGVKIDDIPLENTEENVTELTARLNQLKAQGLEPIKTGFQQAEKTVEEFRESTEKLGGAIEDSNQQMKDFNEVQNRADAFKQKAKEFIGMAGAAKVLRAAVRNAYQDIKELDSAMAEIAVVTDFSVGDMWEQLPEYTSRANELGVAIKGVYEASALYYQQGLNTNEVAELSTETLKMMKIAGLDAKESTDRMTAALRGFNMELTKTSAENVADVYSELAAITAADVNDISIAMTKTASIAKSAGMEFESTAAILSQIIETTQESPETAGTALKTIIARFQELKKAPDEIGEVDGEIVNANQIEGALRSVGVSLRDASGQFRELDDVFMELSSKWGGLDKNTQRYIATIAAGSRQQSRFIAMMQDYERTQELVNAANNSAGASNRQYEKTLETLESKLTRLDNAWSEFTTGIMNQAWVKGAVDGLTSIMNLINKMTTVDIPGLSDEWNGALTSFSKIGLLIGAFTLAKAAFDKFGTYIDQKFKEYGQTIGKEIAEGVKKGLDDGAKHVEDAKKKQEDTSQLESNKDNKQSNLNNNISFKDSIKEAWAQGKGQKQEKKNKQKELKIVQDSIKATKEEIKLREKSGKSVDNLKQGLADLEKQEGSLQNEIDQGSKKSEKNLKAVGAAVTAIGAGFGMVSQMFADMGVEPLAKGFAYLGTAVTLAGSAMSLVTLIMPLFKKGTDAQTVSNWAQFKSWLALKIAMGDVLVIILLISAAVIALIAVIYLLYKLFSGPTDAEKNLEKIKKSAEEASEAAEKATKSYEELNDALSNLDGKYRALEDLTKGTKEWNKAILETNSQVLDLIDKYPELASWVTNEDGVLKLDIESDEVQQVLAKSQQSALFAQSTAAVANAKVSMAELDVNIEDSKIFDKLQYEATIEANRRAKNQDPEAIVAYQGGRSDKYIDKIQNEMVKDYAKQYAMGDLTEEELQRLAGASDDVVQELKRFGEQLVATETEMSIAMSTMASNAVATFGETLSDEQRARALTITQGTIESTHQKNKENFSGYNTEGSATLNEDELAVAQRAVENQYGPGASISSNGLVTYKEGDETKTKDLSDEEMKELILLQQTYEDSIKKVEATEDAFNSLTRVFEDEKTANNILTGNLNKAELEALDSKNIDYLYGQLGEAGEIIYGSVEEFRKQIEKTKSDVNQAYAKSDKINKEIRIGNVSFWKEISSNAAKGLSESLKTVYEKTGTEGAKAIESQFATLSTQLDSKKFEEIVALYNGIDINNQQALLDVEYKLISQYGVSKESAEELTAAFVENNKVVDQLALSVSSINKFTAALVKVEEAMQKAEDAAWDYEQALRSGNKDQVKTSIQDQIAAYQEQAAESKGATSAAIDNLTKIYAAGATKVSGYDFRNLVTISDDGKSVYQTNEQVAAYSKMGKETKEVFEKWLADLQSGSSDITTAEKAPKDSLVAIQGIEDTLKDSYTELRDRAIEAVNQHLEEQISLQEEQINVERNAFNNLINKIQQQIDEDRQARQNEEAQENLNNAYNQLSLMQMDTAGGNQLGVVQLQDDIAKQEQEYQDTLIDQALQNLQDANERAFEQREQQINLQSEALESYQRSEEYQSNIDAMMNNLLNNGEESELYELLKKAEQQGMSQAQKMDWETMLSGQLASADLYYKMFAEGSENNPYDMVTDAIEDVEDVLSKANLGSMAERIATAPFITELSGKGFTEKELQGKTVSELQKMQAFTNRESSNSDIASLKNKLDKYGIGFKSKETYYAENASSIASDSSFDTYGAYLQKLINKYEKEEEEKVVKIDTGEAGAPYTNPDAQLHEGYAVFKGVPAVNNEDTKNEGSYKNAVSELKSRYKDITKDGVLWNEEDAAEGEEESGAQKIGGNWYRFTTTTKIPNEWVPKELLEQEHSAEEIAAFYGPDGNTLLIGVWNGSSYSLMKETEDHSKIKAKIAGQFKTGGLADFTGPAWLDGTKSRPEYVLNDDQTERFFSLVDVLEGFDNNSSSESKTGDSYIDVDINVEKIDSDYDVEKLADKIRSMIYEDSMYRNVNNVQHIR